MIKFEKNTLQKIYYKSNNLVVNENVRFTITTHDGTVIVSNIPATNQIANQAIYYIEITTPNIDTYLLCKIGLSNFTQIQPLVIMVGDPTEKFVFLASEQFQINLNILYQIFDINGIILMSSQLIELNNGFYGINVSDLDSGTNENPLSYFFRAQTDISKFTLPFTIENGIAFTVAKSSGSRYRIADPYAEMNYTRRINASLIKEDNFQGISSELIKDEDKLSNNIKAYLKNQENEEN